MDWDRMTPKQKTAARRAMGELDAVGVDQSVSQVAKYFEQVMEWKRGEISLHKLCQTTGWPLPADAGAEPGAQLTEALRESLKAVRARRPDPGTLERVADIAADMVSVKAAFADLRAELRQAITAADQARGKEDREELVRAAKGGLSRAAVFEELRAEDIWGQSEDALTESKLGSIERFSARLHRRGGKVVFTFADHGQMSLPESDEEGGAEPESEQSAYIRAHNAIGAFARCLRERGLILACPDDPLDVTQGLLDGHPATVEKIPTGVQ